MDEIMKEYLDQGHGEDQKDSRKELCIAQLIEYGVWANTWIIPRSTIPFQTTDKSFADTVILFLD